MGSLGGCGGVRGSYEMGARSSELCFPLFFEMELAKEIEGSVSSGLGGGGLRVYYLGFLRVWVELMVVFSLFKLDGNGYRMYLRS